MTSYKTRIAPARRVFVRLISDIQEELQRAYVEENAVTGHTKADIARTLGKHRSFIVRKMSGLSNMTLETVAALAWAFNREIIFRLARPEEILGYQPNKVGDEIITRLAKSSDDEKAVTRPGPDKRLSATV